MKQTLTIFFLAASFTFLAPAGRAQQPKALFYMTREPKSVRSFLAHADKIDLLVPAWYAVDADGLVSGGPNPLVLKTAKLHHVSVMPLVANGDFVQEDFHKLLKNAAAKESMFAQLIRACKENGYTGFQFDFENVHWTDREALSVMVHDAAAALHREGLQLTIATVPNAPGEPGEGGFSAWIYENWRGAYDLKALAQSVDLICLMTYDQHTRWTAPGPVAGWTWTTGNLDYALGFVPPQKLSLGIPLYGYHWFAGTPAKSDDKSGDKPNPSAEYIGTDDAVDLAKAYGGHIEWDATDRVAWFYFYRADMREWIFFTDAHTFRERYTLVKDRGLQGF
ncbi:MAG TPA: glycosyl hydrolase family 18 protein, partial [Candidatus Acidoferrum sp.]